MVRNDIEGDARESQPQQFAVFIAPDRAQRLGRAAGGGEVPQGRARIPRGATAGGRSHARADDAPLQVGLPRQAREDAVADAEDQGPQLGLVRDGEPSRQDVGVQMQPDDGDEIVRVQPPPGWPGEPGTIPALDTRGVAAEVGCDRLAVAGERFGEEGRVVVRGRARMHNRLLRDSRNAATAHG